MTDHERCVEALRIATLLPPHREDAIQILNLLTALVNAYLWPPLPDVEPIVRRVEFVR